MPFDQRPRTALHALSGHLHRFGNALGSSLAESLGPRYTAQESFRRSEINQENAQAAAVQGEGPWSAADSRNGSDIQSDNYVADRARADALYGLGSNGPVRLGEPSGMGVAQWWGGVDRGGRWGQVLSFASTHRNCAPSCIS